MYLSFEFSTRGDNPRSTYSRNDTSPIKLFEYMASGRPIVASSLPSIRNFERTNAFLVQPVNPEDLKSEKHGKYGNSRQRATCAQMYRYMEKRASSMLRFITKFTRIGIMKIGILCIHTLNVESIVISDFAYWYLASLAIPDQYRRFVTYLIHWISLKKADHIVTISSATKKMS